MKPKHRIEIFLIILSIVCTMPLKGYAADETESMNEGRREVRVGCVDIDNFLMIEDSGYTQGYAVDYLEEIAKYTNWNYEYVSGTWSECMQWLEEGKIDLLMPAELSDERVEKFLFSSEMCCMDYAALVGRKYNDSFYYEDYEAFDGMKVGMIKENYLNQLFIEYAKKNNFSVETVLYATGTEENEALEAGEVDAIISGNMNFMSNQKLLAKISYMPAYFIMEKQNQALMDELNEAQRKINLMSPYYTAKLHEKYYGRIERQAVEFTREEAEYIESAEAIKFLYEADDYPLQYQDPKTKEAKGIYMDIVRHIFEGCGLKLEEVPVYEDENILSKLEEQDSEAFVCMTESWENKEKYQIEFSDNFYTANYDLVGKRSTRMKRDENLKLAVPKGNIGVEQQISAKFPNWEIVTYNSVNACLDSVREGTADLAFINTLRQEADSKSESDNDLFAVNIDAVSVEVCLTLKKNKDEILNHILNKAILKMDDIEVEQDVLNGILDQRTPISISYLIRTYSVQIFVIAFISFIIITLLVLIYLYSRMTKKKNLLLEKKNEELNEAIEMQHMLQQKSEHDPLTGLKNKKVTEKLCQEQLQSKGEELCALLVIDIDDFKKVNDTQGHLAGDRILIYVAECMRETFKDQIIGRIGGDEFLIMTQFEEEEKLFSRIDIFGRKLKEGGDSSEITCSIGAALTRGITENFEQLFAKADEALYEVKRAGKAGYLLKK